MVKFEEHPAMFRANPFGFIGALILAPLGIGLIILGVWWLKCYSTTLIIDENLTTVKRGIFSRTTTEARHKDIRNIQIMQSFFQRIMGTGRIILSTAASEEDDIDIQGIANPEEIARIIREHQNAE